MGKMDGAVRSSSQHMLASLAGCSGLAHAPSEWEINHPAHAAPAGGGGSSNSCVPAAKMTLECDLGYGDPTVHHVARRGKYFGEMLIPLVSCPQSGSPVFLRGGVPGRGGGVKRPLPSGVTGWGRGLRYPSDRRPSVKLDSPL